MKWCSKQIISSRLMATLESCNIVVLLLFSFVELVVPCVRVFGPPGQGYQL